MFKVAFIYPGYENLSIECLSAALKKAGFGTKLFFDPVLFEEPGFLYNKRLAKFFSYKCELFKGLRQYAPDLICFSVISDNYIWAVSWAKLIKKNINVPIVFGGIHPSSVPEKVLSNELVDYVCVGEGDEAIVDLALTIKRGDDAGNIANIWYKKNGQIFANEVRPLICDLDRLPFPDKDLFYSQHPIFGKGYLVSTSRGCLYSCTYCCNNVWKKIYKQEGWMVRRRSVGHVLGELKAAILNYKIQHVSFVDEVFNSDIAWLREFCQKYKEQINLPFFCFAYPDLITDDVAVLLKDAGCYKVQMGVQIVNENKRKCLMGRRSSNEKISRAITLLREKNIYSVCDVILGVPGETEDDLKKMAYFFSENIPNYIEIFWLRYYPKADIILEAKKNGYIAQGQIEAIEAGLVQCGMVRGGDQATYLAKKYMCFFFIMRFFSKAFRRKFLHKNYHHFLPSRLSPVLILVLNRSLNHSRYEFNASRSILRYIYFGVKNILMRLRQGFGG